MRTPSSRDPLLARLELVALRDDHVATVAAAPLEIAAARRVLLERRHDLEKLAPDGKQRVLEPEALDPRVDVAHLEPEDLLQLVDGARKIVRNQADLSQS